MHYYVILDHYTHGQESDSKVIIAWANDFNLIHLYIKQFDEDDVVDFELYEYDVEDMDSLARVIANQFYGDEAYNKLKNDLNAYKLIFKLLKNKKDHIILTQFEIDDITLGIEDVEEYCDEYRHNLINMLTMLRYLNKGIQREVRNALPIFINVNSMMTYATSSKDAKELYSLTSLVDPFAIYKYHTTNVK